jgi:cyclase
VEIRASLLAGADKISINSSAVKTPDLINQGAWGFGSQCIVVAIDPKWVDGKWIVHINGGRVPTDKEAIAWAKEVEDRGAGEILLTSMDRDGTKAGYNLELTQTVAEAVSIPVIASGGAGELEHFYDGLTIGKADAVLAASVFHYNEIRISDLKDYLFERNVPVRLHGWEKSNVRSDQMG